VAKSYLKVLFSDLAGRAEENYIKKNRRSGEMFFD
jgi:hypothetical protein